jgi:N-acylglucosamine 2-epimerase
MREGNETEASRFDANVDRAFADILDLFLDEETGVLHETISARGQKVDTPQGRSAIPGHSIHVSWQLMEEGSRRNDERWIAAGRDLLRAALESGWDERDGGLFQFVDLRGEPPLQLDWDMKVWWVHTEALYATLLADRLSDGSDFAEWRERIHAYAFDHYPDRDCGGWYGFLHRDGSRALSVKGSVWKGIFHVASALWQCISLLDDNAGRARGLRS